ncbi:hypothetical protein HDU98_005972 [Podochytrium sp. JEL0797]|nr:hypothetical protein HDU98_005972 [Podochytrium sp. JEL0797]
MQVDDTAKTALNSQANLAAKISSRPTSGSKVSPAPVSDSKRSSAAVAPVRASVAKPAVAGDASPSAIRASVAKPDARASLAAKPDASKRPSAVKSTVVEKQLQTDAGISFCFNYIREKREPGGWGVTVYSVPEFSLLHLSSATDILRDGDTLVVVWSPLDAFFENCDLRSVRGGLEDENEAMGKVAVSRGIELADDESFLMKARGADIGKEKDSGQPKKHNGFMEDASDVGVDFGRGEADGEGEIPKEAEHREGGGEVELEDHQDGLCFI